MNDTILDFVKTWKPTSDRVVVLPQKQEKKTTTGILISDVGQGDDKRVVGEILAVGKGRYSEEGKLIPIEFSAGDRIIFGKYAGEDLLVNEDLIIEKYEGIVRDDQVLITILRADSLLSILP